MMGFGEAQEEDTQALHKGPPLRSCSSSSPALAAVSAEVDKLLCAEFGKEDELYPQVPFEALQLPPHFQAALDK